MSAHNFIMQISLLNGSLCFRHKDMHADITMGCEKGVRGGDKGKEK